ncbi:MAG: prepilin-type N-terminal cleavage/methylation domain-containing protein [Lachnospiraceae bacterium]|nr:prepilin-type N-terminal cleavage/methylation domain-containing protein [Lachnospiraceae bacterium]
MEIIRKESNNRGFTLVELIVVLVILAILAAITAPALLSYIDKAKNEKYLTEAKAALTYIQADASNSYGRAIGNETIRNYFQTNDDLIRVATAAGMRDETFALVIMENPYWDGMYATPENHAAWTVGYLYWYDKSAGVGLMWDGKSWTDGYTDDWGQIRTKSPFSEVVAKEESTGKNYTYTFETTKNH